MALLVKDYPGMGRGVCSSIPIKRGAIVNISPVIPLSAKDWKLIKHTILESYVFAWGPRQRSNAFPLGFGGLFNHSDNANVSFRLDLKRQAIIFRARRDIAADEQLTIDYMWSARDRKKYALKAENDAPTHSDKPDE